MRTIRRVSFRLNTDKWQALRDLVRRYAAEKNAHLRVLASDAIFAAHPKGRAYRDGLVAKSYASPAGLQARSWKLALSDAHETVSKQWLALAAAIRPRLAQKEGWTEAQKRYAFWLLMSPQRMAQLIASPAPVPTHFQISPAEQKQVRSYLRRVLRRKRGERAQVRKARSMALDANMYTLFFQNGTQYIKVMSLKKGARIVIPLCGNTPIRGNIRLVLDSAGRRVEIHYTAEISSTYALWGEPCALDAGVSEVFTDERGNRYGEGFGKTLSDISEEQNLKGKARNKLYQIATAALDKGEKKKAGRIRKFNLGHKKQRQNQRKKRAELARQINTAINQVIKKRQPQVIVTEKLDLRGKAKSKKLSRRVSMWTRRLLNERVDFKASAGGSRREQVNPAYSSQMCPTCGFVNKDNRRGDTFQCTHCGHRGSADRVAAENLKARHQDPEITLYTPKERVKSILLVRFNARLESGGNPATVSGRTPGAFG